MFETFALLKHGGWPMVPLGLCSVIALAIIIERAIALRHARVLEGRVLEGIAGYRGAEDASAVLVLCQRTGGPLARVIGDVLRNRKLPYAQALDKMHAIGRIQVARLERGLTVLEIIASVSPLMGLLGTVLGMLTVFETITQQGLGDPMLLAGGIREALVTTIAGLCVGIPALGFHSYYTKRVDQLAGEIQDHATNFILRLQALEEEPAPERP
jgi:biopolymer transport protein ExbB